MIGSITIEKVDLENPVPTSINVNSTDITLKVNEDKIVAATVLDQYGNPISGLNIEWSSEDPSIATVDENGKITAVKEGTTKITATYDNLSAQINVTVKPKVLVTGVNIIPASVNIIVGQRQSLAAIIDPIDASNKVVRWSSSNPAVAIVNAFGLVTGVAEGNAVITATTQDGGKTATCNVNVTSIPGMGEVAVRAIDFLNSIGVCTHIAQRADDPAKVAAALAYTGIRNIRDDCSLAYIDDWIQIHNQVGTKVVLTWSGPDDSSIEILLDAARRLANAGALLALEGPNEPNNWAVTYQGVTSVWDKDFLPLAKWMSDFYSRAKHDPILQNYPVFHSSEAGGSEPNNVGLQFLTIPEGAGTLMPDGTQYADYANVHNYICRKSSIIDNMAWLNASPDNVDWVDGIYAEYGVTWRKSFPGYSDADRAVLPKVTTETGWGTVGPGSITEEQQGRLYLNIYLSQFKRGFAYTFIYMLHDDGSGLSFYDAGFNPKESAIYLHNLTTILADSGSIEMLGRLNYSIPNQPETVHDLLLQKSNGTFELVVWDERASDSDNVTVNLGSTFDTVNIYDPTIGTSATQHLSNVSSVNLTLSDHPVIIEIPTDKKHTKG